MTLRNDIAPLVETIIEPVYLVGGSVRDHLMGLEPKDYDFATPHAPEMIEASIRRSGRKPFLTGKRFGTIGVKIAGTLVEITSFRTETYRRGSRKPDVEFVDDLSADLSRRDFTINAMALRQNRLIDPHDGRSDIEHRLIRSVGTATSRFKEDPLRMLRAARLAAQLGFTIEPETLKSMARNSYRILEVSRERWVAEMDRLLLSPAVFSGLDYLMETRLISYMIPELSIQKGYDQNSRYHGKTLWEHTLAMVSLTEPEIEMRWAALLHDMAKPFVRVDKEDRSTYAKHDILGAEMVIRLGRYLRWSNNRIERVSGLVRDHLKESTPLRDADDRAKH
ncbi:MAG: HDIG domain-containing protein [Deltaproteobacteria bacterium]|nr:HDIG domain-containing protein [Deltaproteobacteria bacterium]